jgi:hypothetical protein
MSWGMTFECDNVAYCHDPVTIGEDTNALRVLCKQCKHQYVIRKDWRGMPDNREYSKLYKKEVLQPNDNLFYRYYPQHLKT